MHVLIGQASARALSKPFSYLRLVSQQAHGQYGRGSYFEGEDMEVRIQVTHIARERQNSIWSQMMSMSPYQIVADKN